MSTLEDKILGEKREYYCSSSEDDDDDESECDLSEGGIKTDKGIEVDTGPPPLNLSDGGCSTNTGPKGVLTDWQRYKQVKAEQRKEREKERIALMEKLAFTCRSDLDREKEEDPELSDFLEDPFLLEYSKRKMEEMLEKTARTPKFGTVFTLSKGKEFLDAVDKESKDVLVVVHIYEEKVPDCKNMNNCLDELSREYPEVKFCKLLASNAGVSTHFKVSGVPALLAYKNGTLVGNFVQVSKELGSDFSTNDVENFLIENGMLIDKSLIPSIIRCNKSKNADDELD